MRTVFRLVKWLIVLAVILAAAAFLLPRTHHVERSRVIEAPPEKVWSLISDPREWNTWSPWAMRDPNMKIEYSGAPSGAGAGWSWKSDSQGEGRMRFESADPPKKLTYTLEFTDMGSTATGEFRLEPVAQGTRVTWSFDSDAGYNPVMRWFGLALDSMVGGDFETGLRMMEQAARR